MSQHTLETAAYSSLGGEPAINLPKGLQVGDIEFENFFTMRKDCYWMKFPGYFKFVRHLGRLVHFEGVTKILMQLEPQSTFNPSRLWADLKNKQNKLESDAHTSKKKTKASKDEKMKIVYSATSKKKEILREITQIRNSLNDLMAINRKIENPETRVILLAQILASALDDYEKAMTGKGANLAEAKRLIYELVWTLNSMNTTLIQEAKSFEPVEFKNEVIRSLPADLQKDKEFLDKFMKDYFKGLKEDVTTNTTFQVTGKGNTRLVADAANGVMAVLTKGRDVMEREEDLIRLQLTEMSDSLPPLSRFVFGHTLDPWQIQALSWIDEGKSVVISAPTSSGKTVVSTYVAVIFKSEVAGGDGDAAVGGSTSSSAANAAGAGGDEDDGEDVKALLKQLTAAARITSNTAAEDDSSLSESFEIISDPKNSSIIDHLLEEDRKKRIDYLRMKTQLQKEKKAGLRVLFVVPTEPLVWQVAAYFTKLLKAEGDTKTKVGIVTDQLCFNASTAFNIMPQIVVGTPKALESALTKPRGLTGETELRKIAGKEYLPGGYEHFDWVVYDEVHALDGEEGAALQRLIRSMYCPFLALSATVGNAEELKAWFERVRSDQASNVIESISVKEIESLVHQTRFINLQRYIWDPSSAAATAGDAAPQRLQPLNPLSAVESVQALQSGLLKKSSLSFTSKDCIRVWDAMAAIYPVVAIEAVSPYAFFGKKERITLQRTKDYEDQLKSSLESLATSHPVETEQLLTQFAIKEPAREFNLCEMLLEMKAKEMTPALPFHLNTFEAIRLYQQILSELEWMQHATFPTYHIDRMSKRVENQSRINKQVEDAGRNNKALEELARSGQLSSGASLPEVDVYEPHPHFILSNTVPMNADELKNLIDDIERNDGFKARDKTAMANKRGENVEILNHPLIRGLKRGIGLFVEEVSFPSYRRAIQKLASEGKLGVVVSDSSLAFGVNMPFRTCIFCGEMSGKLDELMAQQMSGRAGRRGLDTQGNIVYAGIRMNLLRKLMIGKISDITGRDRYPRYDTLIFQPMLSPRHVGFARSKVIGGLTLDKFITNKRGALTIAGAGADTAAGSSETAAEGEVNGDGDDYYLNTSRQTMLDLGFIAPAMNTKTSLLTYIPNPMMKYSAATLAVMWEMRNYPHESITIGFLLTKLIEEFLPVVRDLSVNERKTKIEVMEPHIHSFFTILLQLVGRTAWYHRPQLKKTPKKMLEVNYFTVESRVKLYEKWSKLFAKVQNELIPSGSYQHLRDPVRPEQELDGTFLECCLDAKYVHSLDDHHKQEMKHMVWRVGSILKILNDCGKIDDRYVKVSFFVFRNAFKKMQYLLQELIVEVIDFSDVSAYATERRKTIAAAPASLMTRWDDMNSKQVCEELLRRHRDGYMIVEEKVKPIVAEDFCDLNDASYCEAIDSCLNELKSVSSSASLPSADVMWKIGFEYRALQRSDVAFLAWILSLEADQQAANLNNFDRLQALAAALLQVSFGQGQAQGQQGPGKSANSKSSSMYNQFGVLLWYLTIRQPISSLTAESYFPILKAMITSSDSSGNNNMLELLTAWHNLSLEEILPYLPTSYKNYRVNSSYEMRISGTAESSISKEMWQIVQSRFSQGVAKFTASYGIAFGEVVGKLKGTAVEPTRDVARFYMASYLAFQEKNDLDLMMMAMTPFAMKHAMTVIKAFQQSSFVQSFASGDANQALLGILSWYVTIIQPASLASLSIFLKVLYDEDLVDEESLVAWYGSSLVQLLPYLPSSYTTCHDKQQQGAITNAKVSPFTEDHWVAIKKQAKQMIEWLQQSEEEEEGDEEEEEEN